MSVHKTILGIGLVVCLIGSSVIIMNGLSNPSVKGVSTAILPTTTLSSTPTPTLIPTPISQSLSTKIQPTLTKQYGGWYWQSDLNRAQVFIGTDSAGKDIWIDGFPTPTPTPTPVPAKSTQTSPWSSSVGNTVNEIKAAEIRVVEKKIVTEKK